MKRGPWAIRAGVISRSWRIDRRMTTAVFLLMALENASFLGVALALRQIADSVVSGSLSTVIIGAVIGGASYAIATVGADVQTALRLDLADRVGYLYIDAAVHGFVANRQGLSHLEQPDYLDRLHQVRGRGQIIAISSWAVPEAASVLMRILIALALLASINPWLGLMALCAAVPIACGVLGMQYVRRASIETAGTARLERHLTGLTTDPPAGKEIRVFGNVGYLAAKRASAWDFVTRAHYRAYLRASAISTGGWAVFMAGYVGGLALVATSHTASVGDLVLAVTLASQLRLQCDRLFQSVILCAIGQPVLRAFLWLDGYPGVEAPQQGHPAPAQLNVGIRLREVSFTYPGMTNEVLNGIDIQLPAGQVVAIVGEIGSGKSTLVKLLAKFYTPTAGSIMVDDVELGDIETAAWRSSITAAFQDFGRYQVTLGEAVGIGDLTRIGDVDHIEKVIADSEASEFTASLPLGLSTPLGRLYKGGVELSHGQWQKLALARAGMRTVPRLLILDEPTSALDAPSEQAIFRRYAAMARRLGRETGAVTLLISHRYSTVRMADLILVLHQGQLEEYGSHDQLMQRNGRYCQMYLRQRSALAMPGAADSDMEVTGP